MKKIHLFNFILFSFFSINANPVFQSNASHFVQESNEILATISKNTSETQFNELVAYFKENGITLDLTEVNYNTKEEIISINISLEKDGQNSHFTASSNQPISDIKLGYKDNSLFISPSNANLNVNNSLSQLFEQMNGATSIDSLLIANPFSFSFSSSDLQDLINSSSIHFDLDDILGNFMEEVNNTSSSTTNSNNGLPKYNFINTPNNQKLIIIDGKESDFNTLDQLAKNDQLYEVDNLKKATAVSLYGNKAKDGAIIATTKK